MEDSQENIDTELPEELRKMMARSLYIESSFPALSNSVLSGNSENSPKFEFNFCQDTDSCPDSGLLKKKGFGKNTEIADEFFDHLATESDGDESQKQKAKGNNPSNGTGKKKSTPGFTMEVNQYLQYMTANVGQKCAPRPLSRTQERTRARNSKNRAWRPKSKVSSPNRLLMCTLKARTTEGRVQKTLLRKKKRGNIAICLILPAQIWRP